MNGRRVAAWGAAGLAAAVFVALAATRRLNYDELLALRAGWLDLAGVPAAPAFLMPWTLLAGGVGHLFGDPGVVFVALRGLTAAGVAAAFWGAATASGTGAGGAAVAAWLALGNGTVATHGLEFRYDAAVLILLLVAYRQVARDGSAWVLGALVGFLALHHLKGAYFALGVVAVSLSLSEDRRRDAVRLVGGVALSLAVWVLVLAPLGLLPRATASLGEFFRLAESSSRASLVDTMGPVLRRDLAWWLLVLAAVMRSARWSRTAGLDRRRTALLAFAALGVAFWVVHPHAWAYLAAIPASFLCIAAAPALTRAGSGRRLVWVAAAVGIALQLLSGARPPTSHLRAAIDAPMTTEVAVLRAVRGGLLADDRALDPAGLLYFVPPCTEQWYLDTLYVERAAKGRWMAELADGLPASCSVAIDTYRMTALPEAALRQLRDEFRPLRSGLIVRREREVDPRWEQAIDPRGLGSFW